MQFKIAQTQQREELADMGRRLKSFMRRGKPGDPPRGSEGFVIEPVAGPPQEPSETAQNIGRNAPEEAGGTPRVKEPIANTGRSTGENETPADVPPNPAGKRQPQSRREIPEEDHTPELLALYQTGDVAGHVRSELQNAGYSGWKNDWQIITTGATINGRTALSDRARRILDDIADGYGRSYGDDFTPGYDNRADNPFTRAGLEVPKNGDDIRKLLDGYNAKRNQREITDAVQKYWDARDAADSENSMLDAALDVLEKSPSKLTSEQRAVIEDAYEMDLATYLREVGAPNAESIISGLPPARQYDYRGAAYIAGERGISEMDRRIGKTRMAALAVAKEMEGAGKYDLEIKMATGWERGADGMWRYEMPDIEMNDRFVEYIKDRRRETSTDLSNLVKGNDYGLFEAYPEMRQARVIFRNDLPDNVGGQAYTSDKGDMVIELNTRRSENEARSDIVHEIQHLIQAKEGFARGGNVDEFVGSDRSQQSVADAYGRYRVQAGEVEARNVETRRGWSEDTRRESMLEETEDVPRRAQEVRRSGDAKGNASVGEYARDGGSNEARKKFNALPAPEVSTAEVRGIRSGKGFAGRVVDWLIQKGVIGKHRNDDKKWEVTLNSRSVRNVISHEAANGKVALLARAPQLIKNGVFLETTVKDPDGNYRTATETEINDPKILKSHIFAAKAKVDGEDYTVGIVVREDSNGKRYYDHAMIIGDSAESRLRKSNSGRNSAESQGSISNIIQKHLGVNTQNKKTSTPSRSESSRDSYDELVKAYREDIDSGLSDGDGRLPIDLPEMVEMARELGIPIQIRNLKDGVRGLAVRGSDGGWKHIRLDASLPKDGWDQARKVLAHELGHAMVKYGGTGKFRAVATKIKNAAHTFDQFMESGPGVSPEAMFTAKERRAIHYRTKKELGEGASKERVSKAYKEALAAEADQRGLVELKKIYDELFALSKKVRPLADDAPAVYMTDLALLKQEAPAVESLIGMPVGAHGQKGTVSDIRNPFLATIVNDMKMLSFINQNNLRHSTIGLLTGHDNTLGFKAELAERGRNGDFVVRDNNDYKTVFVFEGGKRNAYYVSKEIADCMAERAVKDGRLRTPEQRAAYARKLIGQDMTGKEARAIVNKAVKQEREREREKRR